MTTKTPTFNYTRGAWEGSNYNSNLHVSDITKLIRDYVKTNYPDYKFSVTKRDYNSINVVLLSSKENALETPNISKLYKDGRVLRGYMTEDEALGYWTRAIENGNHGVNQYYLQDDYMLTERSKAMFKDIVQFINSYNFDDSDGQIDYFHTNFYLNLSIGKWDKKYEVIA